MTMAVLPLNLARVSNTLRMSVAQQSLTRTQQSLLEVQNELTTGKKLNVPSDNPGDASAAMILRRTLQQQTGYAANLQQAGSQLSQVDSTLSDLTDLLRQAQSVASANASSTVSADDRTSAADMIASYYNQALSLANTQSEGVYIFGGDRSTQAPFVADLGGVRFAGSDHMLQNSYDDGTTLSFTANGAEIFGAMDASIAGANVAPTSGAITPLTKLADLNGGAGIDTTGMVITNGAKTATIDLSAATTVEDLLNAINGSGTGAVAQINADGTGIELTNSVQGLTMTVAENGGNTASQLGLLNTTGIQANGLFGNLAALRDALIHNDQAGITNAAESLQGDLDRVISIRGQVARRCRISRPASSGCRTRPSPRSRCFPRWKTPTTTRRSRDTRPCRRLCRPTCRRRASC